MTMASRRRFVQPVLTIVGVLLVPCVSGTTFVLAAEQSSPALLADSVERHASQLATIESSSAAMVLFTTTIGPFLGLGDAASTLAAKGLSEKSKRQLNLAELSQSVYQLMAALSAWELADSIGRAEEPVGTDAPGSRLLPSTARQDWLAETSQVQSLATLYQALQGTRMEASLLAATRVALEASQQATIAWWNLFRWKDQIRQTWGQSRLCGTWQWIIHNHQNHQEQKTVLIFPPAGQKPARTPLPTETVVLGDSIYLRWEQDGRIQEDSLLFLKEGTRIEGSFVNNSGGWGSIAGKRTASCLP